MLPPPTDSPPCARAHARLRALGLVAAILLAHSAFATRVSADTESDYQEAIEAALAEYNVGNWEEARRMFARAHEIKPNARALRGMGLADFEGRRYVRAIESLRASLAETRNPLTPEQRASAGEVIAQAELYIARLVIMAVPSNASLQLDGKPIEPGEGGVVQVDPGTYELRVSADGHRRQNVRVALETGETSQLRVELIPLGDGGADHTWTWIAAAGAPVFGGAALAFWLAGDSELEDLEARCAAMGGCEDREAAASGTSLDTWDTLATISLSLAAASAITATVLYLVEEGDAADRARASKLQLGITPQGLTAHGRF